MDESGSFEPSPRNRRDRANAIDHWLREAVAPTSDAMAKDPGRGIPAEHVFAEIRARHAERMNRDAPPLP